MADEDRSGSDFQDTPVPHEPRHGSTQEPNPGSPSLSFWQTSAGRHALERGWAMFEDIVRASPSVEVKITLRYGDERPVTMIYGYPDGDDPDLEDRYTMDGGTLEDLQAHPT